MTCHFYASWGKKSYIPQKKPYNPVFESNFETGQTSVMRGSRQILIKEVFFGFGGHGQLQDNAMPSLSPNSNGSI